MRATMATARGNIGGAGARRRRRTVVAEPGLLRRMLGFGLFGVAAATVLAPGVALVRGTTGHDWYAAGKLTAVKAAIAVGFDEFAPVVEYRRRDGRVVRMSRWRMDWYGEALVARERILETAQHYALLGAGIGGAVFVTTMLGAAGRLPRGGRDRPARPEPADHSCRPRAGPAPAWSPAGRLADRLRSRPWAGCAAGGSGSGPGGDRGSGRRRRSRTAGAERRGGAGWRSRHARPARHAARKACFGGSATRLSSPDPESRRPRKYGRWA